MIVFMDRLRHGARVTCIVHNNNNNNNKKKNNNNNNNNTEIAVSSNCYKDLHCALLFSSRTAPEYT